MSDITIDPKNIIAVKATDKTLTDDEILRWWSGIPLDSRTSMDYVTYCHARDAAPSPISPTPSRHQWRLARQRVASYVNASTGGNTP